MWWIYLNIEDWVTISGFSRHTLTSNWRTCISLWSIRNLQRAPFCRHTVIHQGNIFKDPSSGSKGPRVCTEYQVSDLLSKLEILRGFIHIMFFNKVWEYHKSNDTVVFVFTRLHLICVFFHSKLPWCQNQDLLSRNLQHIHSGFKLDLISILYLPPLSWPMFGSPNPLSQYFYLWMGWTSL